MPITVSSENIGFMTIAPPGSNSKGEELYKESMLILRERGDMAV